MHTVISRCEKANANCSSEKDLFEYGFALIALKSDGGKGWPLIEESANKGFLPALYFNVERYYRDLDGKGQKLDEASKFAGLTFKKLNAIGIGNWAAVDYLNMSFFYEEGFGTDKDVIKAFQMAKISSDMGDTSGKFKLLKMYKLGLGTPKNEKRSRELFEELKKTDYFKNR